MNFIIILITAVALSMDAFAASLSCGCTMEKFIHRHCILTAFLFGLFQALMPLAGWFGAGFLHGPWVESMGHWIAFILLAFIGIKMIWEGTHPDGVCKNPDETFRLTNLLVLAVATSIDALAVGVSYSFLNYPIATAVPVIGITTFLISYAGVHAGHRLSHLFGERMEVVGGVVLVLIGLKILIFG